MKQRTTVGTPTPGPSNIGGYALTYEQAFIYACQQQLKKLETEYQAGQIPKHLYKRQTEAIFVATWNKVFKFGMKLAHDTLDRYYQSGSLSADAFGDISQSLYEAFHSKLMKYNPTASTPTTYFNPYFRNVIANYLLDNVTRLTQYDYTCVKKVNAAIAYFEDLNIQTVTDEMIANKAGLSVKVVIQSRAIAENAKMRNIDDLYDVESDAPSPEDAFIEREKNDALARALETLSDDERCVFMEKLNFGGIKEISYKDIAKKHGWKVSTVRSLYNQAVRKLAQNQDINTTFRYDADYQMKKFLPEPMSFTGDVSEVVSQQLIDGLSSSAN